MRHAIAVPFVLFALSSLACMGEQPQVTEAASGTVEPSAVPVETTGTPSTARVEHTIEATGTAPTGTGADATVQATVAINGQPAVDKVDAPVPQADAEEYPGTWVGVCTRLNDCGCNPMASVAACARTAESGYAEAMTLARSMGTPPEMLSMFEVSEDRLYAAANSSCETICSEARDLMTAGSAGGLPSGGLRIDASAGPGGASISIEEGLGGK